MNNTYDGDRKTSNIPSRRQSSYDNLRHNRSNSEGGPFPFPLSSLTLSLPSKDTHFKLNPLLVLKDNKENAFPTDADKQRQTVLSSGDDKENVAALANLKSFSTGCKALKPSSLQFCMQTNEPEKVFGGSTVWDPPSESDNSTLLKVWDYSDSEAAPASSWSTLPNKSLLCRPLPSDIGRCTCVIVKEASSQGFNGATLFSLYTNEGQGRQDRKLAVANHKRRNGKSEFTVAQSMQGILSSSDNSFLGTVTANLMGSKYHIWNQGTCLNSLNKQSKALTAVVGFVPTITTWTGSYRSMRTYIPKHQSMQLKNTTTQVQHIKGLPEDWEGKKDKIHQLFSRAPQYNKISRQYELDFRERGRAGLRIQSSVKNFQLTLGENGKQTILQLGRVGKSKYVMDYRYPLTGYQAFCICLAAIDSKLCCSV